MKTLIQKTNENKISKFQKLALQTKQLKSVKGGDASDFIIVEEMIEG